MLPTLKNHSNPIWDICPCNIKSLTYARLKFVHFEVHVYILTRLRLFCYCLHIILIKCLSKCMFEWSLKNNICKLVDTCAICWNVNNMNFGVMILHPLSTFGRKKIEKWKFQIFHSWDGVYLLWIPQTYTIFFYHLWVSNTPS